MLVGEIAEVDLRKRVPVLGHDEIAKLAECMNVFYDKLEAMIGKLAHVTDKVASVSVELSATAEEMSNGTDRLNARTSQTAAAVEEMHAKSVRWLGILERPRASHRILCRHLGTARWWCRI